MRRMYLTMIPLLTIGMLILSGCDKEENERVARMAERQLERQAEQDRRNTELQREVASGARQLVAADAEARQDLILLQQEMQDERTVIGEQRDALEQDRKEIAVQRQRDPVIAASLQNVGLLAACLLPLLICLLLLRQPPEQADDRDVVELLIADLAAPQPKLFRWTTTRPQLAKPTDETAQRRLSDGAATEDDTGSA